MNSQGPDPARPGRSKGLRGLGSQGVPGVPGGSGRFRQAWTQAADRAEQAIPRRSRRRFDPSDWGPALVIMLAAAAVLWIVQALNTHQRLDRFALYPRTAGGLWGVLTAPFLHPSWGALASTTLPVLLIGWAVLIGGLRHWAIASAAIIAGGGALTWLAGPSHPVLGASALVYGWIGYLLARAWFSRKLAWIATAIVVLIFFGTLLSNLVPSFNERTPWQANVCSFVAGLAVAWVLHPSRRRRRARERRATGAGPAAAGRS